MNFPTNVFLFSLVGISSCIADVSQSPTEISHHITDSSKKMTVLDLLGYRYFPDFHGIGFEKVLRRFKEPSIFEGMPQSKRLLLRLTLLNDTTSSRSICLTWDALNLYVRETSAVFTDGAGPREFNYRELFSNKPTPEAIIRITSMPRFWDKLSDEEVLYNGGLGVDTRLVELRDDTGYRYLVVDRPDPIRPPDDELRSYKLDPLKIRDFSMYLNLLTAIDKILKSTSKKD